MIRLAVFDLGNVVFATHFEAMFEFWAGVTGRNAMQLAECFAMDELFQAFEKGWVSSHAYHLHLCHQLNVELSFEDFRHGWCAIYGKCMPATVDMIHKLKAHCKVVALTNTNELHSEVWPTRYADTLQLFDALYISSELGLRKPEKKCFEYVLADQGVGAGETLFFDDSPANVQCARELGLIAILVTDAWRFVE